MATDNPTTIERSGPPTARGQNPNDAALAALYERWRALEADYSAANERYDTAFERARDETQVAGERYLKAFEAVRVSVIAEECVTKMIRERRESGEAIPPQEGAYLKKLEDNQTSEARTQSTIRAVQPFLEPGEEPAAFVEKAVAEIDRAADSKEKARATHRVEELDEAVNAIGDKQSAVAAEMIAIRADTIRGAAIKLNLVRELPHDDLQDSAIADVLRLAGFPSPDGDAASEAA